MDKSYALPYPQVDAKMDTESAESRLNASREAIRLRLKNPESGLRDNQRRDDQGQDQNHAQHSADNTGEPDQSRPINSWSSLLMSMIAPSAKKVASQHPYTLIGGSALLGAYLAWSKPWRGVLGSVIAGAVIRNLVSASFAAGSRNGGRILQHYLSRTPAKKYPPYQKQEHAQVYPEASA